METETPTTHKWINLTATTLVFAGLYLISIYNYLLFHSLAEMFSIVIACGIFIVAWNSRQFFKNNYLLFLGIAYLFIGGIDLVHTLSFKGMGVFKEYGPNLPTQLWIVARYIESLSLVIAPLFLNRELKIAPIFTSYLVATVVLLMTIFTWAIFPDCFIEGEGLTLFKKFSEYIISFILIISIILLNKKKNEFDPNVFKLLVASIVITVGAELAFTFYISVFGLSNLIGHFFKIISFYFIYKAIIETGLRRPYALLFRNLQSNKDALIESEEKFKTLFDNAQVALFRTRISDGKLLEINERYANIAGYANIKECMENFNAADAWVDHNARDELLKILQEKKSVANYEAEIIQRDGIHKHIMFSAKIFHEKGFLEGSLVDITNSKKAEKALKESEFLFSQMFEQSTTSMCFYNPEGTIVRVNHEFCKMFGVNEKTIINSSYNVLKDQAIINAGVAPLLREIFDEKKSKNWEIDFDIDVASESTKTITSRTGKYFLKVFGYPVLNHKGNLEYVVLQHYDITGRKQAEDELREREARYSMIFNSSNDAVFVHGAGNEKPGKFTEVNNIACQRLGYSRAELLKMSPVDIDAGEMSEKRSTALEMLMETGQSVFEMVHTSKSGDKIPVEISSRVFEREGEKYVLSIARDITARKMTENTMKENEQRYIKAQRLGLVGNWEYDLVTEKFWGSDEAKRIYGFDPKSKKFTADEVENCIPERERVHQALIDLIENNKPYNLEFEIHPITGPHSKIIKSIADIIKDDSGAPLKVAGVIQDITQQKNAEKEKSILERHLQEAQKMEAIGTLAGGIAHDFNNILSPLLGYAEMLKEDLPADHPFQENADTMISSALRARDLVQQILTFSRKTESEVKPIKLQSIVREAIKLLRPSIPKTIDINQSIDSECSPVNADSSKLHQVIMNLATNAYHAMEKEGGTLTITLKQIYIEQGSVEHTNILPGTYAYLTVADTGIGIEKDVIDKVYDPYFTTKEQGKGTGLGLSVVHGIVKEFGGDIRIQSEPGKGTQFHVYIPIIERRTVERVETTGPVIGGTERILLVDDEEAVIRMEERMLERLGYQVTTRTGSIEALEAFKANSEDFDFIISDMTMPNMTGIQLAQKIRNIKADIPIIICTGFSDQLTDEKCQALGIQGYVMKPVIIKELAGTIRRVLDASGRSS